VSAGAEKGALARIRPGAPRDMGLLNTLIVRVVGRFSGGGPPNILTTLARHRGLFRRWLLFAGGLMPGGKLRRAETELVILQVAHLTGCAYEWDHHARLGRRAGLSAEALERIRQGDLNSAEWSERERVFLRACTELHAQRDISDETWSELGAVATEVEIIELCLLVGHYEMLAMVLHTLRVPLDTRRRQDHRSTQ
jgi:AhpD family alkylhydroperoxidase